MINDPVEAIDCAARYLFGTRERIEEREIAQIRSLLKEQKKGVEAYAGVRGDYLLMTKNCHFAVIPSSYVLRASHQYSHIDFIIPKPYTFLSIENFCIPVSSQKESLVYTFINYLFQPEVIAEEAKRFYNFPALLSAAPDLVECPLYHKTLLTLENYDGTFYYTRDLISETEARTLWIKLKSD